jgi:hypothetical protein
MNSLSAILTDLKELPWDSLVASSPISQQELVIEGERWIQAVWTDRVSTDQVQVVVQLYRPGILGSGKMQAQGFKKARSGEVRELSETEISEFL